MWILKHAFFAETFSPMNATLTFQIGLNDSAWAIRGKFTFAGAWKGFLGNPDNLYVSYVHVLLTRHFNECKMWFKYI